MFLHVQLEVGNVRALAPCDGVSQHVNVGKLKHCLLFQREGTKKSQRGLGAQGAKGEGNTRPDVPEKLMLNLSSHRTAAIQALMLGNQPVTLAALAHRMAAAMLKMKKDGAIAHASQHVLGHRWLPTALRNAQDTKTQTAQTAEIDQAVESVAVEA